MRPNHALSVTAWLGVAITVGCAGSPATTQTTDTHAGFVTCKDPRPEACTMHYDPVCGVLKSGVNKTYSNGCTACSDPEVSAYRAGACTDPPD